MTIAKKPAMWVVAWCLQGGRAHRAYRDPGRIGGEVWWCPRHGFLFSFTHWRWGIAPVINKRPPRRLRGSPK